MFDHQLPFPESEEGVGLPYGLDYPHWIKNVSKLVWIFIGVDKHRLPHIG